MKKNILLLFILFSIVLSSCEDIVEVQFSNEVTDLYAVEAEITTQDNPYVFLYKSQKVNVDDPYLGVSGASVKISDNSQPVKEITLNENPEKPGLYEVENGKSYFGKAGKTYMLRIEKDGIIITANEMLAKVEPIDSIQVHSSLRGDNMFLGVYTFGDEPVGLGNYYKWDVYINNELLNGSEYLVIANDELVDGKYVGGFEIFTDFHDPNKPEERKIQLGDTVQVKQNSISSFAYYFYYQMFNQGQTGGLFSVPPANIESNFTSSNGEKVLGIFTALDVSSSNVVVVDENIENQLKK